MAVSVSATPNPHAMKFDVGQDVGPPKTWVPSTATDDALASALFAIDGVASVFMTADFVTISKLPEADWDVIVPAATAALEVAFP